MLMNIQSLILIFAWYLKQRKHEILMIAKILLLVRLSLNGAAVKDEDPLCIIVENMLSLFIVNMIACC